MYSVIQFLKLLQLPIISPKVWVRLPDRYSWLFVCAVIVGVLSLGFLAAMIVHGDPDAFVYRTLAILIVSYMACVVPINMAIIKGDHDE